MKGTYPIKLYRYSCVS